MPNLAILPRFSKGLAAILAATRSPPSAAFELKQEYDRIYSCHQPSLFPKMVVNFPNVLNSF